MSFRYQPSDRFPTGILHINLYFGRNLTGQELSRPVELLGGKADPYVVVNYDGREAPRSKVCTGQGSSPEWNQHFYFPIREGDTPKLENTSSRSDSRRRLSKLLTDRKSLDKNIILEPDTLEIKVFDKNNFRNDFDMGRVRIPYLTKVITSTPNWYLEKQPFPVFEEVKGDLVSAGELWMAIGFQVVDEAEFESGWNFEPSLDGWMYDFKPRTSESSPPQVEERDNGMDDERRTEELITENSRLSQKVEALKSQLNVSEEKTAALEMKLKQAADHISNLEAQNKKLDDKDDERRIEELIRENSRLSQKVEALISQLNVSEEKTEALEMKLKQATDHISDLDTQNKKLDDKVSRLIRNISELNSSGFWQTLCCCFGSFRHPQDIREETAPLLGVTPNKPAGPSRATAAASKPGPPLGTSK